MGGRRYLRVCFKYANGPAKAEPRPQSQSQSHSQSHFSQLQAQCTAIGGDGRYSRIICMQMSDILTGFAFNMFDNVYRRRQATLWNTMGNYAWIACGASNLIQMLLNIDY